MNFENIHNRFLRNKWTRIEFLLPDEDRLFEIHGAINRYESRGRFKNDDRYIVDGNLVVLPVWFELEEDATYFALKYTV